MTEPKFTPGPWRVSYERGTTQIRTADSGSIMCDETYYPWVPENDADWHLISAAPEMYQALENLLIAIGMGWDLDGVVDVAKSALAKAEGGVS